MLYKELSIEFVATDTACALERRRNRVAEAVQELPVEPLERRGAVRRCAAQAPLFVFIGWPPMHAMWCSDVVEDAGQRLEELVVLSAPPQLIQVPRQEVVRRATRQLRATEEPGKSCRSAFNGFRGGVICVLVPHKP